jgi:hypothetical protein
MLRISGLWCQSNEVQGSWISPLVPGTFQKVNQTLPAGSALCSNFVRLNGKLRLVMMRLPVISGPLTGSPTMLEGFKEWCDLLVVKSGPNILFCVSNRATVSYWD